MNLKQLSAPFPANDVEWRIQSSGVKGDGTVWARCLAYITNRAIMDRLDEVCEPHQWKNEYRHEANGAVMCGISIKIGDEWVTKWDGAENTDIEAVKGGLSGAMKRAGYQWGIGRYLYQLEEGFARVSENGAHYAKTKDGKTFRWDAPALPAFALPAFALPAFALPAFALPGGTAKPAQPAIVAQLREQVAAVESRPVPTIDERAPLDEDEPPCPKCGGAMFDNRLTKRNPKAPDRKCKDRSCDGVIWPPRETASAPKSNGKSAVAIPPIDSALGGSPTETPSIDTLDKFLAEDFGQWARDDRCSPSTAEELGRYQAVVVAVLREDSEQNAADIAAFKQILQYVDAYEDCQSSARDTIDAIEDEAYARVSASSSQETPNG